MFTLVIDFLLLVAFWFSLFTLHSVSIYLLTKYSVDQIADLYDSPREFIRETAQTEQQGKNVQELLQQALDRIHTLEVQLQHE